MIPKQIQAALFVTALAMLPVSASAAGSYHLSKTITIGGNGGWDYLTVDDAARRVYVSHGTEVDVLDADSYKIVGKIENLQGVHGIALAPDLGHGFISDGHGNAVVVFDMKTLKTIAKVDTGKNPDAIVYEPVTHKIFAFNGGSGTATVIDTASNKAVGTIDLGGKPEFAAVDGKGHVFDNLEDKSVLVKIDAAQQKVTDRWVLAPCEEPSSLAMDSKSNRLFAGCHNKLLAVINGDTGKVVATQPIGEGVDATVFDLQTALVMSTTSDGTMTVIHEDTPDKYSVAATVQTQKRSRTLALDPRTHRLFIPTAQFGAEPAPTPDHPHGRPTVIPGSFSILVFDAAG